MENIKRWWMRIKAQSALDRVQSLEHASRFIVPEFLGKTAYPIKRDAHHKELTKAQEEFEALKEYL